MIRIKNLTVGYENKTVLKNISLEIPNNNIVSIIGPNGCGKTTLLKAIAGLLPHVGEITIGGLNIKEYNPKEMAKKIGMLSQTTNIFFNHTVWDTVMMGRYVHQGNFGLTTKIDKIIVEEALMQAGIEKLKHREINTLSGGQLQRVFIAKLIAQDPDIILLDEPTNHLDISFQVELIKFIKKWAENKRKTVIGVLHDINLAMLLSDKMILMNDGKLLKCGNSLDVCGSTALEEAYNMNIGGFMLESLIKWEEISKNEEKIYSIL